MQISERGSWVNNYLVSMTKSFLIWTLTLTVCFLVVGFPLVVVLMTMGVLAALILQSIIPASAIVVVAGGILGATAVLIMLASLLLTFKGVRPDEVQWLGWLHDKNKISQDSVYASCPLTCGIENIYGNT